MLQNGLTYEIIRPEMVGIPHSTLILGKHSGRHALERRCQELGYQLTEGELIALYQGFTALAERKREILDEDLLALLHESFSDAPEEYQLSHLRVVCGSVTATAEVRMTGSWTGERSARGTGDGPIAAAFAAVSEILERQLEVQSLSLRSLTPGRDSVGQVFLQAKIDGKSLTGHGASTDIVEASTRALVHALNKARHADKLEASSLNSVYLWGV
jgi:2-isopropylmalate synthase